MKLVTGINPVPKLKITEDLVYPSLPHVFMVWCLDLYRKMVLTDKTRYVVKNHIWCKGYLCLSRISEEQRLQACVPRVLKIGLCNKGVECFTCSRNRNFNAVFDEGPRGVVEGGGVWARDAAAQGQHSPRGHKIGVKISTLSEKKMIFCDQQISNCSAK